MRSLDRDSGGMTGADRLWAEIVGHDYEARMCEAHAANVKAKAARRAALLRLERDKIVKAQDLLIRFQCKLIDSLVLDSEMKALCGKTQRQWLGD